MSRVDDVEGMKPILLALVLAACGRAAPFEPVVEQPPAPLPPPTPKCVAEPELASSRWQCETVGALEIVSVKVTNADGSSPWTTGQPRVSAVLRNVTGQFLNYPGLQVAASAAALQPAYARESLYGMGPCTEAELSMQFNGSAPKGTEVTFTAIPAHINGDECVLTRPPVKLTVTAP